MELGSFLQSVIKRLDFIVVEVNEDETDTVNTYYCIEGQPCTVPKDIKSATIIDVEIKNEILYIYVKR